MNQVWAKLKKIPPSKGVPERQRGRGMLVRLLDNLWVNRMNIPLRRFAFTTRRGPPSKGEFRVSLYYPNLLSWSISLRFSETDQQDFV